LFAVHGRSLIIKPLHEQNAARTVFKYDYMIDRFGSYYWLVSIEFRRYLS